jgi:hypothetical protein
LQQEAKKAAFGDLHNVTQGGGTRRQSQRASLDTVRDDGFKTGDVDSQSTSPSDSLD